MSLPLLLECCLLDCKEAHSAALIWSHAVGIDCIRQTVIWRDTVVNCRRRREVVVCSKACHCHPHLWWGKSVWTHEYVCLGCLSCLHCLLRWMQMCIRTCFLKHWGVFKNQGWTVCIFNSLQPIYICSHTLQIFTSRIWCTITTEGRCWRVEYMYHYCIIAYVFLCNVLLCWS